MPRAKAIAVLAVTVKPARLGPSSASEGGRTFTTARGAVECRWIVIEKGESIMTGRWALLLVAVSMLAGCQNERFRSMRLGDVDFDEAYRAGLEVFAGYYGVADTDARTGRVTGRPKLVSAPPDKLFSSTPSREVAVLRIRRDGALTWADVRVDIQRRESASYRSLAGLTGPNDVPNRTPAQGDAPLRAEQDQVWQVTGHNYDVERKMLKDLYARVNPGG